MMKLKKVTPHIMLGVIVGAIISFAIITEGSWIYWALENKGYRINDIYFNRSIKLIAILAFLGTILLFNTKKVKKFNLNKISIYLLYSIIISGFIAFIIMGIVSTTVISRVYYSENINIFKINLLTIILFVASIGGFVITFLFFINKKVRYIKYLTSEVKKFKSEGFGKTIAVQGEDEIAELCESINSMSMELKERIDKEKSIEQNKNQLITNVSHDLRTPLTSIIGYLDLIKSKQYKSDEQFNEYIDIIDEKTKCLNKLINELFEYTKLNNYDIKLNYSKVDIVALVEQIVGEYSYIFEKEGLTLVSKIEEKSIILDLDIEKFVRVLDNLLINAKKYSLRNTEVTLALYEEENNIVISISNKTNDINEEDIPNLFERFYKGDKSRANNESSGLGLSIVKRIIELHHGEIYANIDKDNIYFTIKIPK